MNTMQTKQTIVMGFVWQVDNIALFTWDEDYPKFFQLDSLVWEDMGRPQSITVAITPGDSLN